MMSYNKRQKSEGEVVIVYKEGVNVPTKHVTEVIFEASVTEISDGTYPEGVFSGCTNLKAVVLNEGVRRIADNAFRECTSLRLPSNCH